MDIEGSGSSVTFREIHKHFQVLPRSHISLLSQVGIIVKFILLMPATNAVSERSVSAMHRIKTYLHTTMHDSVTNEQHYGFAHPQTLD